MTRARFLWVLIIRGDLMALVNLIALVLLLNFCHAYGLAENRLFREAGEYFPGKHFRLYHAWLAGLDFLNGFIVYALSGSLMVSILCVVYFPLGLDIAWWVKRWLDFHYRYVLGGITVSVGPESAPGYYGETNAWHAQSDWDNYFKGELWLGCYSWWWVFGAISIILLIFSFGVHV